MTDVRLIERWLPIAALGEESIRERRTMTALPPTYYLHVWWARRPLVASRAAVLASLLPADVDRKKFLQVLGIHGDPVEARRQIDIARRTGERIDNPYGYGRAFNHTPDNERDAWLKGEFKDGAIVLDPTAGGGSIPFESLRAGFSALANDLNPVAALIMKATVEWPSVCPSDLGDEFLRVASEWRSNLEDRLHALFPQWGVPVKFDLTYLWARTITCPYCAGLVPLSPNWRLAPGGTGVRLIPDLGAGPGSEGRTCSFEIVERARDQSAGTVSRGDGACPYSDCGRVIDGDEVKRQAQAGDMGEQLYAVVYKKRVPGKILRSGKRGKDRWVRGYRAPVPADDNQVTIAGRLAEKLPEWEALDLVPSEGIPDGNKTSEPRRYGMPLWRDLFSPRQLLCHGTSVEVFREMLETDRANKELTDVRRAAYGYLALTLDKLLDRNSLQCTWDPTTNRIGHTFQRHDFAFKWSYAEMAPLVVGLGYDWAIGQTAKCINELVALASPGPRGEMDDFFVVPYAPPPITITCKSGDSLDHIEDGSIDAVVMDPPYYDNVMYAELSDFFYVWLKRTAGHVFPDLFRRNLTDKENEAVANPVRFRGKVGAKALAGREYQERMASMFAECRRVLKPDGIMTLMFTHKATGAWDALTKGLMEAGFAVTASWPVNTEAEGSLHIRNKAAANSTVFLACRPRAGDFNAGQDVYWEDVEPEVAKAVRKRFNEFRDAGIAGVDLYLASFGPALEEFSRHWPLKRGTPREMPEERRRRVQQELFDHEWDPYAATPEDALDAARREVKKLRLEELTHLKADADLDPSTAFFVLAWDAFRAPVFSYDEALRLARAVGVDLDNDVIGSLAGKKGSDIILWDSAHRAAKGTLGSADGSRGMIDAIHHAANLGRMRSLAAAQELLTGALVDRDTRFFAALEAVLEVLPVSGTFTGIELEGEAAASGSDFEVLYKLSRLAYSDRVDEPEQLKLWRDDDG
ncbi:MAG: DUF1156 domain-containing protein [Chloroflexi bacterium]|nr:DUF1156 domain-containing protein [Chloroflexota bacterium]